MSKSSTNRERKRRALRKYMREMVCDYKDQSDLVGAEAADQDAIREAIKTTEQMADGRNRLKLIQMVLWDGTYTLEGAARTIPCDRATAARWQRAFFEEVARNRGLLD